MHFLFPAGLLVFSVILFFVWRREKRDAKLLEKLWRERGREAGKEFRENLAIRGENLAARRREDLENRRKAIEDHRKTMDIYRKGLADMKRAPGQASRDEWLEKFMALRKRGVPVDRALEELGEYPADPDPVSP